MREMCETKAAIAHGRRQMRAYVGYAKRSRRTSTLRDYSSQTAFSVDACMPQEISQLRVLSLYYLQSTKSEVIITTKMEKLE